MFATYLVITLVASVFNGCAAVVNLIGHEYAKTQADTVRVPRWWTFPLGSLLAAGALGLLVGFGIPVLGTLAAGGLVLYFLSALGAHLRARNYQFGRWAMYFSLAVAALAVNLAYHGGW